MCESLGGSEGFRRVRGTGGPAGWERGVPLCPRAPSRDKGASPGGWGVEEPPLHKGSGPAWRRQDRGAGCYLGCPPQPGTRGGAEGCCTRAMAPGPVLTSAQSLVSGRVCGGLTAVLLFPALCRCFWTLLPGSWGGIENGLVLGFARSRGSSALPGPGPWCLRLLLDASMHVPGLRALRTSCPG